MEGELRHYDLRTGSRSRSRTPLVQNRTLIESETSEHHYDLRSHSRERSHTPGEVISRKFVSKVQASTSGKVNDQSMRTIVESIEEHNSAEATSESTKKITENVSTRKGERRSERQRAKRQVHANGQSEKKEDLRQCKSVKVRKNTSDYSSDEGEREDSSSRPCSAHEIYKKAGDWWNVFPKTDYTYSERSQCRYEIAPGILAMPNMSRPAIHSHKENFQQSSCDVFDSGMYETVDIDNARGTTTVEHSRREVICTEPNIAPVSRQSVCYTDTPFRRINSRQRDVTSFIDSDTELDEPIPSSLTRSSKIIERLTSFVSVMVSWFSKLLVFLRLKRIEKQEYRHMYEYRRNVAESRLSRIWKIIDRSFANVYFFLVKVFLFDTWLLSCGPNARARLHKNRRVLWIVLLPLLFLFGYWCLPYFPMLFYSTKAIARQSRETSELTANDQSISKGKMYGKDTFRSIGISNLDQTVEQAGQHFNDSEILEQLKESERVLSNIHTEEMDVIKLQFERLRELYSELKLCCNARTKYVTNEDLEMRLNMFLTDYLSTITSMTNEAKVRSESSIAMDYGITDDRVRAIVKEALKIYDADKTGRVDYALESAGGQIVSTRCTQRYDIKTRAFKLLAFTLYHENNNPRTVIQGNPIQPGTCWAFQGFPGYLLIKLRSSIYITGFTLEHAPKSILPNGEMRSAPKKFNVWGFLDENDLEPVMFGDYEFVASDDSLQYFPVQNITIDRPYEYVELRIHSNHGQLEYTCLYRFRVHGRPI